MRVDLITLSVVGISGGVSCWEYLLSIGYKFSQGGHSTLLLQFLSLCLIWSPRWLGLPAISHAANHLPKSLITKAERELCFKTSKSWNATSKKVRLISYFIFRISNKNYKLKY